MAYEFTVNENQNKKSFKDKFHEWREKRKREREEDKAWKKSLKEKARGEERQSYEQGFLQGTRAKAKRQAFQEANRPSLFSGFGSNLKTAVRQGPDWKFIGNAMGIPSEGSQRRSSQSEGSFGLDINPQTGLFGNVGGQPRKRGHKHFKKHGKGKKSGRTIIIKV